MFLQKSRPGFVGSISFRSWRSPLAGAGLCVQVAKRRYYRRYFSHFSLGKMQNNLYMYNIYIYYYIINNNQWASENMENDDGCWKPFFF